MKNIFKLGALLFLLAILNSCSEDLVEKVQTGTLKGIVIRNRTTQALCENTLRLTVGTEQENKKLIEVLKQL